MRRRWSEPTGSHHTGKQERRVGTLKVEFRTVPRDLEEIRDITDHQHN
jgi:hypothetical protein